MKLIIIILLNSALCFNIFSQSQWLKTNGLTGGPVNCVFESGSKLYAGTNNGIFKSTNSGNTFSPSGIYDHQVIQILALNSRLYAVDGNYLLFRSVNEGSTWTDISLNIPGGTCQELLIHKNTLFAVSSGNGLYRSTNNGNNWVLINNGISTGYLNSSISTSNYLYVSSGTTLYRSGNNGNSWVILNSNLPSYYSINKFGIYNNILFANLSAAEGSLLYKSTNNGVNWIKADTWNAAFYLSSLIQSGNYFYASVDYNGIFRSSDAGTSWSEINNGINAEFINSNLHLNQGTNKIYTSVSGYLTGGLFVNNNSNIWIDIKNGLLNGYVNDLLMTGNNLFAATNNGIFRSSNNGNTYTQVNNGLSLNKVIVLTNKDNNTLYAGTSDSGVYYSTNAGTNWIQSQLNTKYIASLAATGNIVYAGTNFDGIYRSTDNGVTWSQTVINNRRIRSIAVKGNMVYAGTGNTHGRPSGSILVSKDNGINWSEYSIESPGYPVLSIGIFDNNKMIAASSNGVYSSTNFGVNWSKVNSLNKIGTPTKLVVMRYGDVYVSNSYGVAGSYDYGNTWENISFGLLSTRCISIAGNLNWLFVSPEYMGIWKLNLLAVSLYKKENIDLNNNPLNYSIGQNYPNPFNPATTVDFSVPAEGNIKIVLYDYLGKEVKTIINNNYLPGRYSVTISGDGLASGVYFYKLESINFSQTKKMLLIK